MKMRHPIVGNWYKDVQTNALFEVVDWDPVIESIELQYLDGEVAAFDLEAWHEMNPQHAEAPEDWRSPFELDDEDLLDPDLPFQPEDWNSPINSIEPETMYGVEEY
ncbi:MAG: DUF6763 family protein [Pseudomonadota bacterium]